MAEWRLWEGTDPPAFTTPGFFRAHPRIDPGEQVGHAERTEMAVAALVHLVRMGEPKLKARLLDLGCGDGSFLAAATAALPDLRMAGVDAGTQNIQHALSLGLEVVQDDFTLWPAPYIEADIVTLNEVLEHLVEPPVHLGHAATAQLSEHTVGTYLPMSDDGLLGGWHGLEATGFAHEASTRLGC